MGIPAGSVKGSVLIIISDIRITVSFSHQISHHIQMTLSAAKYIHLSYPNLTYANTECKIQPGYTIYIHSERHAHNWTQPRKAGAT